MCEKFRIPSPRQLLSQITSEELTTWRAYYGVVKPYLESKNNNGGAKTRVKPR